MTRYPLSYLGLYLYLRNRSLRKEHPPGDFLNSQLDQAKWTVRHVIRLNWLDKKPRSLTNREGCNNRRVRRWISARERSLKRCSVDDG